MKDNNEVVLIHGVPLPLKDFPLNIVYEKTPMPEDKISGTAYMEKVDGPKHPKLRAKFVKFIDGASTKPHTHSGGQVLFCTEGEGFIEFNGREEKFLPGTRAIIPSGVEHRHGASPHKDMVHLAVTSGETI